MKKVIGHARKSTKDQSNFIIVGQQRYINEYCDRQEIVLIEMFTDDSKSAKNFDRPENANIEQKGELLNQVFNSGIVWVNGSYRTPSLFSLFQPKAASLKEHGLLEIYANDEKTSKYVDCTRDGS